MTSPKGKPRPESNASQHGLPQTENGSSRKTGVIAAICGYDELSPGWSSRRRSFSALSTKTLESSNINEINNNRVPEFDLPARPLPEARVLQYEFCIDRPGTKLTPQFYEALSNELVVQWNEKYSAVLRKERTTEADPTFVGSIPGEPDPSNALEKTKDRTSLLSSIIFIAIGDGGIVAEKALTSDMKQEGTDESNLLRRTAGVIFLSSPFDGSHKYVQLLENEIGRELDTSARQLFGEDSKVLKPLATKFQDTMKEHDVPFWCYYSSDMVSISISLGFQY